MIGLAGIVGVALVSASASVSAQTDTEDVRERADALRSQALDPLVTGRFVEAEGLLRQSLELVVDVRTLFNLAVALRGQGRFINAREMLREGMGQTIAPERRTQYEALLEEVEAAIARLRLTVQASGSVRVSLDGSLRFERDAPFEDTLEIDPGAHNLQLEAEEFLPSTESFHVAPGAIASVQLDMTPDQRQSLLVLVVLEEGAEIEIVGHGREAGRIERRLAPAEYEVRVHYEGRVANSRVTLPAARDVRIELDVPRDRRRRLALWMTFGALVIGAAVAIPLGVRAHQNAQPEPIRPGALTFRLP